jgi:hypothetical protein
MPLYLTPSYTEPQKMVKSFSCTHYGDAIQQVDMRFSAFSVWINLQDENFDCASRQINRKESVFTSTTSFDWDLFD